MTGIDDIQRHAPDSSRDPTDSRGLQGARVLAFVPRLWPVWGAGTQRTAAFIAGLVRSGAHVTAITLDAKTRSSTDPPSVAALHVVRSRFDDLPWQVGHVAMCLGISDPATFALAKARRAICDRSSPDMVFASGGPFSAVRHASTCARHRGVPLVCDMRDEWSANPFLRTGPWHALLEKCRERATLSGAAVVTAPNREVLERLTTGAQTREHVIPHGCDRELVEEHVSEAGPPLGPTEPLVLLFAGARYGMINEDRFLATLDRVESRPSIRLRLVGSERPVRAHVAENVAVDVVGPLDHQRLMEEYSRAHVLLALGPPERGEEFVPSKFEEYKATGRPIISLSRADGELHNRVQALRGGYAATEDDPASLETALQCARRVALAQRSFREERTSRSWVEVGREAASLAAAALEQR